MSETQVKSMSLPIGPIHVALEEPMYYKIELDGERVKSLDVTAGHVHRGMEALATKRNIFQNTALTERVCSLCSNSHPLAYCMTIENLTGLPVPPRALYLRSLAEEVKRVASHLFNVGIMAHVIGYKSLFMHVMEVREIMQDVKETVYGNRMDIAANCIGGVKYNVDETLLEYMNGTLPRLKKHITELVDIYRNDTMIKARTKGIGYISKEDCIDLGLVGPVARGSGLAIDVRKDSTYAAYPKLQFSVITEEAGDVQARALVRLREALESLKIIRQIIVELPDESLACVIPQTKKGEAVARVEAPRGELFYYIRMDGTDTPLRLKWRVPSYMNWDALLIMMRNCFVSDVSLIVNSIDPCISCTER